ncbi:DUF2000 domain-containing protein [Allorhizocola rhizosphaerae]|uniref:DUF2000 domain-containing protein n=1 Tax=Allorhizocola rhizosphaerae TaxID=1872709 RepID=UPI000E3B907B|nr:DUF2000 domain-containing protein [Allorhizocola rhizosphaerae]
MFDTKIAVLLRNDLAQWQGLNVTAFLAGAIMGGAPELLGDLYADADGVKYLAMFRQPVLVFEGDSAVLAAAHQRALQRGLTVAVYTEDLFATGNDADNRAAVRAVKTADLNLVGLALHAPKNAVDKVLKGAMLHR